MAPSLTTRPLAAALARRKWICTACQVSRAYSKKASEAPKKTTPREPPDHRKIGHQQELFMSSIYSPGSPIFLPHGTRIFTRLVEFLRKQYTRYGFEEVITPTIYKKALWAKSGHLENYAEDMYSVTGKTKTDGCCSGHEAAASEEEDGEYGLKPMNCPGHCLIFASKQRSYRDLPMRYADFSPLHRNENTGSLTGLTRVRRFHQDDGHIFCRPIQVEGEIKSTLDFVKTVYSKLFPGTTYRLALSTRPEDHFIGTPDEWDRAEESLRRALDASGMDWTVNKGDGAFYGPKIDIILTDSDGKEHQTATIQLDFQLPKRFELEYQAPAPEFEAEGKTTDDATKLAEYGPVRPVMIHRAVLGSVERLMALLIEHYDGKWPFWLHPRQVIILTVNDTQPVVEWAETVRDVLVGRKVHGNKDGVDVYETCEVPKVTGLAVDIDTSARPLGAKLRESRERNGEVLVIGDQEVENRQVGVGRARYPPQGVLETLQARIESYT